MNVRTSKTLQGGGNTSCTNSFSSRSNLLNVSSVSATPTINPPSCGLVTSLTGTSTEPAGTVLQFYTGGTAGARNGTLVTQAGTSTPITAVVGSAGNWSANFTGAQGGGISAGTVITARAKAPGKVRSVNSNAVSATAGPSGTLSVTGPIAEGSTSISGTGPTSAAGGSVIVYIDGTPFNTPVLVASNGTWTVSGFAAQELFAGASVTATYTSGQCESKKGAATVVQCKAPQANYSITPVSTNICGGSTASFTLSGSEYGVSYRLLVNGAESGSSVVGTGSAITLTSAPIANTGATSTNVNISYRARKISGTACDATSSSISYGVRPQPTTSGLSFSTNTATVCAGSAATFTLAGTNNSYFYQLLNQGTGQLVGDMVQGTGGSISLSTGTISSNTSFSLRVFLSNTDASACTTTLPSQISVTITSPSISRAVFADNPKVCLNGATRINVSTEPNSNYTYTVYRRVGTSNNPSSDPVLGTFTGNGDIRSVTTGALGTAGTQTFYVRVTNSTGSCGTLTLTNTAQVEVTNTAVAANAGPDVIICAEEYVLRGNDVSPGIGTWSQVSGPSTAVFSSVSNPTSTVSGLVSGTYTFRWQATSSCSGSSSTTQDEVVIRVNCPATYTLAIPQYRDDYANGEALASATDPDGTITAAALTQGTLPPGTALNTTTGAITVANRNNLEEGTYPLTITLTDQFGVSSPVSIVLRIYGNSPAITPLPVELVYFRAQVQGQKVQLQWLTASEEDNKAFVVERSADGKAFTEIGTVPGAGTTLQEQRYTFVDAKPLPAANYYRLKQVDYDGDIAYSGTELVNMQLFTTGIPTLQAWPNPFKGTLHLLVQANTAQEATIKLSDVRGRQVYTSQLYLQTGANELELQLKDLPSGLYILRVQGGQLQESLKLIHK